MTFWMSVFWPVNAVLLPTSLLFAWQELKRRGKGTLFLSSFLSFPMKSLFAGNEFIEGTLRVSAQYKVWPISAQQRPAPKLATINNVRDFGGIIFSHWLFNWFLIRLESNIKVKEFLSVRENLLGCATLPFLLLTFLNVYYAGEKEAPIKCTESISSCDN